MDKIYLTTDEQTKLKELQTIESELVAKIGELEINIELLKTRKSEEVQKALDLSVKKNQLAKELQDKYGEGSINVETGEFIKNN